MSLGLSASAQVHSQTHSVFSHVSGLTCSPALFDLHAPIGHVGCVVAGV